MIKYSDKDTLGSKVNNLYGSKFNAYYLSKNCMNFTNNACIKLSDDSKHLNQNIRKITFWMSINSPTSAYRSILNNFFPVLGTAGNMLQTEGTDQIIFYYNGKFLRWKDDVFKYNNGYLNFYEFTYDTDLDNIFLKVNGREIMPSTGPAGASMNITKTYIGTRYINGVGHFHQGKLADIKCYDADGNLLHYFPLTDNSNFVKDAVTNNKYQISNYTSSVWQYCNNDADKFYLDFMHGRSDVAEFKNLAFPKEFNLNFNDTFKSSDPNLGADINGGWNIENQLTSRVTHGNYIAGTNVKYLKNHDPSDLPEGCDYGIDLKTNNHVGYSHSYYYLGLTQVNPRNIQIKYWENWGDNIKARVRFWYKRNLNSTATNFQVVFGFGYCYISVNARFTTEWTLYDKIVTIPATGTPIGQLAADSTMFAISAYGGNPEDTYIASIAGLEVEILDAFDVANPAYGTYRKDTGNVKELAIYNKKQLNTDNLKRLENKFKF